MSLASYNSKRILLPVEKKYIYLSLLVAICLNFMPTREWPFMPDFLALVLCFWSVRYPNSLGMGSAFILGLAVDVADGTVLGVHPMAYVILVFIAQLLSKRILWFPLLQQSFHILPLLIMSKFIEMSLGMMIGNIIPSSWTFVGAVIAGLLWTPVSILLLLPQYRSVIDDENRTI